jgi:hypothetical protein
MELKIGNKQKELEAKSTKNSLINLNEIEKLSENFDNVIAIKNEANVCEDENSTLQDNFKRFLKMRKVNN